MDSHEPRTTYQPYIVYPGEERPVLRKEYPTAKEAALSAVRHGGNAVCERKYSYIEDARKYCVTSALLHPVINFLDEDSDG